MNHQKLAIIALGTALLVAIVPALLLVLYVDPFQVYHKPFISGMSLQENQRYQNAGLINNYLADPAEGYDSVMIGTSMSENFTGAMVNKTLRWKKAMRLFMPGAVAEEQIAVLRHALDTGRVKHVLLELHPFLYQDSYHQKKQIEAEPTLYFPAFLYNDTLLDDGPYLFNIDILKMSWQWMTHAVISTPLTPENIGYWGGEERVGKDHQAFNSSGNISILKQQTMGFVIKAKTADEIKLLDYPIVAQTLLPLLKSYCNADVEIVLFVPPWPRFRYQKSEKVTLRSLYMLRYILNNISACANIRLYDFDLLDFTGDLNNYKDEQHYLPAINQLILDRIASQQNQLTLAGVDVFENRFVDTLNHYSIYTTYHD